MPTYMQQDQTLLPDGIYPFKVTAASEKVSNNGNPKIELTLAVAADGRDARVYDNLTFTKGASWRIDAFRQSTGEVLKGNVEASLEAEDCIDRMGMCSIVTETYKGKARNKVEAYLLPEAKVAGAAGAKSAPAAPTPRSSAGPAEHPKNEEGEPDGIAF